MLSFLDEPNNELLDQANREAQARIADKRWQIMREALDTLPAVEPRSWRVDHGVVVVGPQLDEGDPRRDSLIQIAKQLGNWKKGPFNLCGLPIDAEWRSDLKWDRLKHQLPNLQGQRVLDVGCNNGYSLFRLAEQQPEIVLGIDPIPKFMFQYQLMQHYAAEPRIAFRLWGWQQLVAMPNSFDTLLCMGILYHHRSPFDLLNALRGTLKKGGTLFLETIVMPGDEAHLMLPPGRYAGMRNVWFLPTLSALLDMLSRSRFRNLHVITSQPHSTEEQRSTAWHPEPSYAAQLHPGNPDLTVEGLAAPWRAIVMATA